MDLQGFDTNPKKPRAPAKADAGERGKWAEKQAKELLTRLGNANATFDWQRMPDARAARGALAAQIGDYEFFAPGVHGVLEVKEIAHDRRLPRDKLSQLAHLRKRALAGGSIVVAVYFSTIDAWRAIRGVEFWGDDFPPSWDLSDLPYYHTLERAIHQVGLW
jgi:hypothetical protein